MSTRNESPRPREDEKNEDDQIEPNFDDLDLNNEIKQQQLLASSQTNYETLKSQYSDPKQWEEVPKSNDKKYESYIDLNSYDWYNDSGKGLENKSVGNIEIKQRILELLKNGVRDASKDGIKKDGVEPDKDYNVDSKTFATLIHIKEIINGRIYLEYTTYQKAESPKEYKYKSLEEVVKERAPKTPGWLLAKVSVGELKLSKDPGKGKGKDKENEKVWEDLRSQGWAEQPPEQDEETGKLIQKIYFADEKGNISYQIFEFDEALENDYLQQIEDASDYDDDDFTLPIRTAGKTTLNLNSIVGNAKAEPAKDQTNTSTWQTFWNDLLKPKSKIEEPTDKPKGIFEIFAFKPEPVAIPKILTSIQPPRGAPSGELKQEGYLKKVTLRRLPSDGGLSATQTGQIKIEASSSASAKNDGLEGFSRGAPSGEEAKSGIKISTDTKVERQMPVLSTVKPQDRAEGAIIRKMPAKEKAGLDSEDVVITLDKDIEVANDTDEEKTRIKEAQKIKTDTPKAGLKAITIKDSLRTAEIVVVEATIDEKEADLEPKEDVKKDTKQSLRPMEAPAISIRQPAKTLSVEQTPIVSNAEDEIKNQADQEEILVVETTGLREEVRSLEQRLNTDSQVVDSSPIEISTVEKEDPVQKADSQDNSKERSNKPTKLPDAKTSTIDTPPSIYRAESGSPAKTGEKLNVIKIAEKTPATAEQIVKDSPASIKPEFKNTTRQPKPKTEAFKVSDIEQDVKETVEIKEDTEEVIDIDPIQQVPAKLIELPIPVQTYERAAKITLGKPEIKPQIKAVKTSPKVVSIAKPTAKVGKTSTPRSDIRLNREASALREIAFKKDAAITEKRAVEQSSKQNQRKEAPAPLKKLELRTDVEKIEPVQLSIKQTTKSPALNKPIVAGYESKKGLSSIISIIERANKRATIEPKVFRMPISKQKNRQASESFKKQPSPAYNNSQNQDNELELISSGSGIKLAA